MSINPIRIARGTSFGLAYFLYEEDEAADSNHPHLSYAYHEQQILL